MKYYLYFVKCKYYIKSLIDGLDVIITYRIVAFNKIRILLCQKSLIFMHSEIRLWQRVSNPLPLTVVAGFLLNIAKNAANYTHRQKFSTEMHTFLSIRNIQFLIYTNSCLFVICQKSQEFSYMVAISEHAQKSKIFDKQMTFLYKKIVSFAIKIHKVKFCPKLH